jgi:glycosidase
MNEVAGKWERAKMAATVLLTIPGTPFLYYGEEIGMTGAKPDEKIRTPMQWSAEKSAGFSTTFPWESINADYTEKNVAQQTNDLDSLFSLYRSLIYLRSNHPALRTGDYIPVDTSNNAVLAFLRVHEEEVVLVLINLGTRPLTDLVVSLAQGPLTGTYKANVIFGEGQPGDLLFDAQGGFKDYMPTSELSASSSLIIQLKK